MLIVSCLADIYDVYDCISHFGFISHGIGSGQFLLDQIKGKEKFILL